MEGLTATTSKLALSSSPAKPPTFFIVRTAPALPELQQPRATTATAASRSFREGAILTERALFDEERVDLARTRDTGAVPP